MLEIPESKNRAKEWNEHIKGKVIGRVVAGETPHGFAFFYGDKEHYPAMLEGKKIGEAKSLGGQIEVEVEKMRLLFGDGVVFHYKVDKKDVPKKHQLLLEFADGTAMAMTVQMYGALYAFPAGENDNPYYLVAKKKPDPLADAFDENYFMDIINENKETLSAKALLATDQRIPGLGNGCLQDILFTAKVNPMSKMKYLDGEEKKAMYRATKEVLQQMTGQGGRDTEKDIFGNKGGYSCILSKNTYKQPCPVCGELIVKKAYLGGSVYYCPTCQPIKK